MWRETTDNLVSSYHNYTLVRVDHLESLLQIKCKLSVSFMAYFKILTNTKIFVHCRYAL